MNPSLVLPSLTTDIRRAAIEMLARRDFSRRELQQKLVQKFSASHATVDDVCAVVAELANDGVQDDTRFAHVLINSKRRRGYGPMVIRQQLRQSGIDAQLINELIDNDAEEWQLQACQVCRKRFGSVPPRDAVESGKRSRFLQYRGFTSGQIRQAIVGATDDN